MNDLIQCWKQAEAHPFSGWDFSYLQGRMLEEREPWSYLERAATLLQGTTALLDLGTGGGERLLDLRAHWPPKVAVTEEYPPNIKLARERLEPLGVQVFTVELSNDSRLPFVDGAFDRVLNRHNAFPAAEVARVLAPGGIFLTQQVHGLYAYDLIAAFGAKPAWPEATPAFYLANLEEAGLTITTVQDWAGQLAFTDVGAIVYYLKAVPWLVPGFSVDRHLSALLALQEQLAAGAPLVFTAMKYLIEAQKVA
ncbi:MAG: class I SAM-dependent methyltransferase [Caldilineaceae bacterium]|nr:class I SAM-dependent methyltransferase [Caldilineaceae bacterium]